MLRVREVKLRKFIYFDSCFPFFNMVSNIFSLLVCLVASFWFFSSCLISKISLFWFLKCIAFVYQPFFFKSFWFDSKPEVRFSKWDLLIFQNVFIWFLKCHFWFPELRNAFVPYHAAMLIWKIASGTSSELKSSLSRLFFKMPFRFPKLDGFFPTIWIDVSLHVVCDFSNGTFNVQNLSRLISQMEFDYDFSIWNHSSRLESPAEKSLM